MMEAGYTARRYKRAIFRDIQCIIDKRKGSEKSVKTRRVGMLGICYSNRQSRQNVQPRQCKLTWPINSGKLVAMAYQKTTRQWPQ